MKHQILFSFLLSMMLLSFTTSCEKEEAEQTTEKNDNQKGKDDSRQGENNGQGGEDPAEDNDNQDDSTAPIVVNIDAEGKADGGHRFVKIDDTNFYIDDIKYTISQGDLHVSGYDSEHFKGEAKFITTLKYDGREMHVVEIVQKAFYGCTSITSVVIPSSVTSIGEWAFYGCTNLTSAPIPSSVTSIGERAFQGCYGLTSVIINSNRIISKNYSSNNNLRFIFPGGNYIIIGDGVTRIGNCAFSHYVGMTSVIIPDGVTCIGESAFYCCTGLTSISIPSSVTSIESYAFGGCEGLTSVSIPSSVTSIGSYAFGCCTSLTSISIAEGNPTYNSRDNCNAIIETHSNTLIVGCKNTIIPSSVTCIGEYAFSGGTDITSVSIPSSVTSIGSYAFINCTKLTDVFCYAETVPSSDSYYSIFYNSNIANATLHVPAGSVETYKSTSPWSGFKAIVAIE